MQKRASLNEKFNGLAAARFTKQANTLTDMLTAGAGRALSLGSGINNAGVNALNAIGLPAINTGAVAHALRMHPETLEGLAGLGLGAGALGAAGLGAAKAAPKINKAIAGMSPEQKKKALKMLAGAGAVGGAGGAAAMYGDDVLAAIQKLRHLEGAKGIPQEYMAPLVKEPGYVENLMNNIIRAEGPPASLANNQNPFIFPSASGLKSPVSDILGRIGK